MKGKHNVSIVWFRKDLRVSDNPALLAASGGIVVPLFIWAPEEEHDWPPGGASRWWLDRSLTALQEDLAKCGSNLVIRRSKSLPALLSIIQETQAKTVFWNRCYEPWMLKRDHEIESALRAQGIRVKIFNAGLLKEPASILNRQGKPYQIFTAYWNWFLEKDEMAKPCSRPRMLVGPRLWPHSLSVQDLRLRPSFDWAEGIDQTWKPGERNAQKILRKFAKGPVLHYREERDRPDHEGTSRLSPYLHFGEISPRTVWNAIPKSQRSLSYLRQIVWREFSYYLLYHFPHIHSSGLRRKYDGFPWRDEKHVFKAWQEGKTGYPIVDAGMRQLWRTGWMHNRVRMIVASFLVKHLLIRWQKGARWFWDTLVDADLANNTMGWQWAAGCGADAAPYFRIFNPVLQGEKFDPQGNYVRRWVSELVHLPASWIHKPWQAPEKVLSQAGIVLGQTYPEPIVNHEFARRRALTAYAQYWKK
ncbi:MAG: DNA photolyase family protein [Candidatus Omnitrophica bacterium]|nr:DNA photolyase family protein [Candidatus Omnitrophota bacterium]